MAFLLSSRRAGVSRHIAVPGIGYNDGVKPRSLFSLDPQAYASKAEVFETILQSAAFRIERIVSSGNSTPKGRWLVSAEDEWVMLLAGKAKLFLEGGAEPIEMYPGDWVNIPAQRRHRVQWTEPQVKSIWLAIHYQSSHRQPDPARRRRRPRPS